MDCTVGQKALIRFVRFLLKRRLSVCKFNFYEDFVYQIFWVASDTQVWSKICNVFFKCSLWRVASKKPKGLAFDKSFFYLWSVTEGEMRVLKCFCRFKVRADVKDGIFVASLAFI